MRSLILKGVRQNNLKDIELTLPLGQTIIVTGPSGSGKSSLAFETIYAEGQRRYMQSLSTYARQFLDKFKQPKVDAIENIPPTLALEQSNPVRNSRATVGTTTEVYDYLRLLFEKVGIEHCEKCNIPMEKLSHQIIYERIIARYEGSTLFVAFENELPSKPELARDILAEYMRSGYTRAIVNGSICLIEELLKNSQSGRIVVVIDRIRVSANPDLQTRITEAIQNAWSMGSGSAILVTEKDGTLGPFELTVRGLRCPRCGSKAIPRTAIGFSFNSPLGACETCKGFGNTLEVDETLVVPHPGLSLAGGAINPFTKPSLHRWQKKLFEFCKTARIDADSPYRDLPPSQKKLIFEGDKRFRGVKGVFRLLEKKKYKMRIRVFISRYTSPFTCPACKGDRLSSAALRVKIGDLSIAEVCSMSIDQCQSFIGTLALSKREKQVAADIFVQLNRRLETLTLVGLGYLTLSRLTRSCSGGEYQRILLATQLSQGLTDTLYVLDEPSIGLHPKDTQRLLAVLDNLKKGGNSLVIVEHDPEVIDWGDYIIDLGPGSGTRGGHVVFSGNHDLFSRTQTQTAKALREWKEACKEALARSNSVENPNQWLEIRGACSNNLKHIDVKVPLERLVAITGVSGSGKSTLIVDTLYQALVKLFQGRSDKIGRFESISGFEFLHAVELVDQSPIGKSSRSNPVTFIKAFDEIRSLFAHTREAIRNRLTPGHFSFNVKGGRCDACEGEGRIPVDMVFLEDVWIPCE
ncbi:MAG: excinuclease ABC subunit UvrA, partial [Deltaproteobacteria bacterium]|nr:excinuclease ABC subunit UvrA [Deltaproteobacteria bacterium]